MEEHKSDRLLQLWGQFERVVKHETRYFLDASEYLDDHPLSQYTSPHSFLTAVGRVGEGIGLFRVLKSDQNLYRARLDRKGRGYKEFKEIGPPPASKAVAGRMNPAGISYMYLAKDSRTAVCEILSQPPSRIVVGRFQLERDLAVLDLTDVSHPPSVFDIENYEQRQSILFLQKFVREISAPVAKDGQEHIEFVLSQIVSEFFARNFFFGSNEERIGGMVYPSALVEGGQNVVIFPPKSQSQWQQVISLIGTKELRIQSWDQFQELL